MKRISLLLFFSFLVGYVTAQNDSQPATIDSTSRKTLQLKEVSIAASKPVIIRTSEKTIFNVAESPSHQTGTAEDVLQNMPGVSLDQKGNISIIGKQGVKIYVDGKPSILAQTNLQAFLKSTPANSIESIELITNPSARYDADGNAGIINIKLKKGKRDGLNGSAMASYGLAFRLNGNFLINYRKEKFNLFATYSTNWHHQRTEFNETRRITVGDSITRYQLHNPAIERQWSHTFKAGLDYFIDDKNTFTYTANANFGHNNTPGHSTSLIRTDAGDLLQRYESEARTIEDNFSVTNDFLYAKTYDTTERKLTLDFNHTYVFSKSFINLNSHGYDPSGNLQSERSLYRNSYPVNKIHNFIFQLDYAEPLKWKGQKIETGLKNETTLNRNTFEVYDSTGATLRRNNLLSNGFNYTENVAAFYFILSGPLLKWLNYSAGLRSEHTLIKSSTSNVERNYLSFFPSATLGATINEQQNMSISYSRRIQRPSFQQLNNTITYFDQYSTWEGNPYLRPTFRQFISWAYNIMVKKHVFSLSAEGNFSTDIFSESTRVDENRIARGGVINGSRGQGANVSFYTKLNLAKWCDLQLNNVYVYQHYDYKSGVNTGPIGGSSYQLWGDLSFRFWKNCIIDFNGSFNTGEPFFQGKTQPWGMLNASIKKAFFHDHFTVAIIANNLTETMKWKWYVNNTNLHTDGSWQNFSRTVHFSLTYTFGKNKNALKHRDLEGNERLNGGGGKK